MSGKRARLNLLTVFFAVLTVGSMALFFNTYEPWQPIGPELIPDGSFSGPSATNAFSGWSRMTQLVPDGGFRGSPGVVLTASSNQNGVLRFTVYNLTNIPAFRASLRAAACNVVQGKHTYHIPRAIFFYRDAASNSLYGLSHKVIRIPGDAGWRYSKAFFPVPAGAIDARFHIQNLGIKGTMRVDDLSVIPVREKVSAPLWKLFFGTLWMTAFGFSIFALRPWTHRLGPLIMLALALIMTGIVVPGELLDDSIKKSIHIVNNLIPAPGKPDVRPEKIKPPVQQTPAPAPVKPKAEPVITPADTGVDQAHLLGHFVLFSLLAFLSALSWLTDPSLRRAAAVYAVLAFFAAATEVLQFIPSGRSAGLSDFYVDAGGMAVAVALVFGIRCIQRLINRD